MRKQAAVARGFPPQRLAQGVGIDLDQKQPGLAEKMLPCRLRKLGQARKMDEAVAQIVSAASIHALPFGLAPGRAGAYFVDPAHVIRLPGLSLNNLGSPELQDLAPRPYRRDLSSSSLARPCCGAPATVSLALLTRDQSRKCLRRGRARHKIFLEAGSKRRVSPN